MNKQNNPNFTTHAIEDLHQNYSLYRIDSSENTVKIIDLLHQSIKFFLPDNADLISNKLQALPSLLRLPYPVIAIEYYIHQCNEEMQKEPKFGVELMPKNIALAFEINKNNIDEYLWLLDTGNHDLETYSRYGAIAVIPINYSTSNDRWVISPFGSVIQSQKHKEDHALKYHKRSLHYGGKNVYKIPFLITPSIILPDLCDQVMSQYGNDSASKFAFRNTRNENKSILQLIEILSCNNVSTDSILAPEKLNKKREAKGLFPLYEYKILKLDMSGKQQSCSQLTGSHQSPRMHLRRGHIRRLKDKSIWVNSAIVGNNENGVVNKDYKIST